MKKPELLTLVSNFTSLKAAVDAGGKYRVASFYTYSFIPEPETLVQQLREFCIEHRLLGRILVAREGVNCAVCGTLEDVSLFKNRVYTIFHGISFREQNFSKNVYHGLVVRTRKEIVAFGREVDVSHAGEYITPEMLKKKLDDKENIILLDARNTYETSVGRFEHALTLPLEHFREFPQVVHQIEHLKDKEIVMYCTGGVRCEKSSAYLKEKRFSKVKQLKGGVLDFIRLYPGTHFKGSCFVFDDRLVSQTSSPISTCVSCGELCDVYVNCHNLDCDMLFFCCSSCQEKTKRSCSPACLHSPRRRR